MKNLMFRQPREAAIVYSVEDEELHTRFIAKKRRRLQLVLTIILALVSCTLCILMLLGMREDWADSLSELSSSSTTSSSVDYLVPDAVELQKAIAEKILRLHVKANSDSVADQEVKLLVRDAVLSYLGSHMSAATKEEAISFVNAHRDELLETANHVLSENGFSYTADARIAVVHFPLKVYEDVFLPAGIYDALQINLGAAEGENWWCILFPSLCLPPSILLDESEEDSAKEEASMEEASSEGASDSAEASAPPRTTLSNSRTKLTQALEVREYDSLVVRRESIRFTFRFLDLFRK